MQLQLEGFPEAEVRAHSIPWLEQVGEQIQKRKRFHLADLLEVTALATSVAQGDESGKAQQALDEALSNLRYDPDSEESAYWFDPEAKPDMQAIQAAGILQPSEQPPPDGERPKRRPLVEMVQEEVDRNAE